MKLGKTRHKSFSPIVAQKELKYNKSLYGLYGLPHGHTDPSTAVSLAEETMSCAA